MNEKIARIKNLSELKGAAVKLPAEFGLRLKNSFDEEELLQRDGTMKFFCTGTQVVFWDDNHFYVVPYSVNPVVILVGANYKSQDELGYKYHEYSAVLPEEEHEKWAELTGSGFDRFSGFFGNVNRDMQSKYCYMMPKEGVDVMCYNGEAEYYIPFADEYIGYYAIQNGIICYVNYFGITYISVHVDIVKKELDDKGYELRSDMWVPFAHGDRPAQKEQKQLWNMMEKSV